MKNHKQRYVLSCLTVIFLALMIGFNGQVQAQALTHELITAYNGDIWKVNITDNTTEQLTTSGYNYSLKLSPDGLKIAYAAVAPEAIKQMKQGGYNSYSATDIFVMDIATGESTTIADQTGATPDSGYMRSETSWSPDGTKLLWTELAFKPDGSSATMKIYDLNTATTATFADANNVVGDAGMVGFTPMEWGAGGIASLSTRYVSGISAIRPALYNEEFNFSNYDGWVAQLEIHNPDTGDNLIYAFAFGQNSIEQIRSFVWVTFEGRSMIALKGKQHWQLLDPLDGTRQPLDFPPRLRNNTASSGLELLMVMVVMNDNEFFDTGWAIADGQETSVLDYTGWHTPSISSDGTMFAWHSDDGLVIWDDGNLQTIQMPEKAAISDDDYLKPVGGGSIVWGTTAWFVDITSADCFNSPPTRLALSEWITGARVLPGDPNNVRSDIGGDVIGQIPAGGMMEIMGASKCDEQGIRYYPISFYSEDSDAWVDGWTAEGMGTEYWLEPVMLG